MGNRISIEQEEKEEAEFQRLVQEVVRVRVQRSHIHDIELGYGRNDYVPDGHIQDLTAHRVYSTLHDPRASAPHITNEDTFPLCSRPLQSSADIGYVTAQSTIPPEAVTIAPVTTVSTQVASQQTSSQARSQTLLVDSKHTSPPSARPPAVVRVSSQRIALSSPVAPPRVPSLLISSRNSLEDAEEEIRASTTREDNTYFRRSRSRSPTVLRYSATMGCHSSISDGDSRESTVVTEPRSNSGSWRRSSGVTIRSRVSRSRSHPPSSIWRLQRQRSSISRGRSRSSMSRSWPPTRRIIELSCSPVRRDSPRLPGSRSPTRRNRFSRPSVQRHRSSRSLSGSSNMFSDGEPPRPGPPPDLFMGQAPGRTSITQVDPAVIPLPTSRSSLGSRTGSNSTEDDAHVHAHQPSGSPPAAYIPPPESGITQPGMLQPGIQYLRLLPIPTAPTPLSPFRTPSSERHSTDHEDRPHPRSPSGSTRCHSQLPTRDALIRAGTEGPLHDLDTISRRRPTERRYSRSMSRRSRSASIRSKTQASLGAEAKSHPHTIIPPTQPTRSTTSIERYEHIVVSFERPLQEILEVLREQHEYRRQYNGHLLRVLKLQGTRVPDSIRPCTPSVDTEAREHVEERVMEKKEVNQQESLNIRAYPNLPYAAGLGVGNQNIRPWEPEWAVFPLKVFRGPKYKILHIQKQWDDADLLRELNGTYDRLRTWRKWISLRNVSGITMVLADHSFIYPQRVGSARVSPEKLMRLRYLLQHSKEMRERYEFMSVLTSRVDLGIEFVERFQLKRIAFAIFLPVVFATIFAVLWAVLTHDISSAFTMSGYMTSAYSVCLVLIGVINLVES